MSVLTSSLIAATLRDTSKLSPSMDTRFTLRASSSCVGTSWAGAAASDMAEESTASLYGEGQKDELGLDSSAFG
jgi:hypothetical protein